MLQLTMHLVTEIDVISTTDVMMARKSLMSTSLPSKKPATSKEAIGAIKALTN